MVRLENVSVFYGKNKVLDNVSCQINEGDFITIMGHNGAGKSTLFNVISGKIIPQEGKVFIDGKDVTTLKEEQRALFVSRLFQNTYQGCVSNMTVEENLALIFTKKRAVKLHNALKNLSQVDLPELLKPINLDIDILLKTKMGSLSGGQRQMISFLMATLTPTSIFLLDEPTAALDPVAAVKLLKFAKEYIKEHSVTTLLITHDPEIALRMGNRLLVMSNGKIFKEFKGDFSHLSAKDLIGELDYDVISK